MRTIAGCVVALSVFAGGAWAVEPPPANPLAGPPVGTKAERLTLIERDFDGKIKRLDMAPAEAAVRKMKLDDASRAAVDRIINERAALLDRIVRENLKLFVEGATARQAGDQEAARKAFAEFAGKAEALRQRGMIGREFAAVLPAEQAAEMESMVREYMQAVLAEPREGAGGAMGEEAMGEKERGRGDRPRRGAGMRGEDRQRLAAETLRIVGAELARSYDRVVGTQVRSLDAFLKEINATPEQEGKIRQITGDSFQKNYGQAKPAEQARIFREVYLILTPEQREVALKRVREQRGG